MSYPVGTGPTGRTVARVAINWLLRRPTVATVTVGARDEARSRENLGAVSRREAPLTRTSRTTGRRGSPGSTRRCARLVGPRTPARGRVGQAGRMRKTCRRMS